ncbi:helix-turn-helix domain-containing protein [Paenibacillus sp. NRS-1783]|uniref:helix-turn-helix domain-containing protein n=1 Tax=Paenibacillus sp. NRS-1783 TaxID=3233907 RepID=UPI003D2BE759
MSLGERLKKERTRKGWSQIFFAQKVGIGNNVLSNYERNYRDPDTNTLTKMADLLEVSTDYLLGRTDIPYFQYTNSFGQSWSDSEKEVAAAAVAAWRKMKE